MAGRRASLPATQPRQSAALCLQKGGAVSRKIAKPEIGLCASASFSSHTPRTCPRIRSARGRLAMIGGCRKISQTERDGGTVKIEPRRECPCPMRMAASTDTVSVTLRDRGHAYAANRHWKWNGQPCRRSYLGADSHAAPAAQAVLAGHARSIRASGFDLPVLKRRLHATPRREKSRSIARRLAIPGERAPQCQSSRTFRRIRHDLVKEEALADHANA